MRRPDFQMCVMQKIKGQILEKTAIIKVLHSKCEQNIALPFFADPIYGLNSFK